MKVIDLLVLPQPSQAGSKRPLLDEYLHNPFLDDDLQELALRLGVSRAEVAGALGELCQDRFLKKLGQRGYALDLGEVGEKTAPAHHRKPGGPARREPSGGREAAGAWLEALPFGLALLRADGSLEKANERAVNWMGIPREAFDARSFARATGVDPTQVLEQGTVLSFTRRLPFALEVEVRPCPPAGVVIVVQDVSVREELARIQAGFQEAFFARLRLGFVEPLEMVEDFLENPDPRALGAARAAVEQMRWMLAGLLADPPSPGGEDLPGTVS
jgi:PAS domain-containing protein